MESDWGITEEGISGDVSAVIQVYQLLMLRTIEHFFPGSEMEQTGEEPLPSEERLPYRRNYAIKEEGDEFDVTITWFNATYRLKPGVPRAFLQGERKLVETVLRVLDLRFRTMYGVAMPERARNLPYAPEDQIVMEYLGPPAAGRVPVALEVLRASALSTYENREISTGVVLLGTDNDPAEPEREKPEGALRYNIRLTLLKGIYPMCDGLNTVFLVDKEGDVLWPVDIRQWANLVQGHAPPPYICPRSFYSHAQATRSGRHTCMVLLPTHEIKVFSEGVLTFSYTNARWRLLEIPAKYGMWNRSIGPTKPADLAARLFQAALNLAHDRHGALFVVLRDTERSLDELVDPGDRMDHLDQFRSSDNPIARPVKQMLHLLMRGRNIEDIDDHVLESISAVDGALVTDITGRLLTFGAILRTPPRADSMPQVLEGARGTIARTASHYGPVLKVSQDGGVSMFLDGQRLWDI